MDIQNYIIKDIPQTAFYIKNFITESEENLLLSNIYKTPKPKWTQLSHRRLINVGGIPHKNGMIAETIPEYLQNYVDRVNSLGIFEDKKANHILVNEYTQGQGIMPHFDGPLFYPTISTLSLGSHTVLEFFEPANDEGENSLKSPTTPVFKLFIEPRSLLILKHDMYEKYLHSISEIGEDDLTDPLLKNNNEKISGLMERKTRISLTIRHVPKTSKLKLKISR